MREEHKEIQKIINSLTDDEDHRQSLWIHYLEGNSPNSFVDHLQQVALHDKLFNKIRSGILFLRCNPPPERFMEFISNFSDFERSIMFLLMLDFSLTDISEYKTISIIRLHQIIATISSNDAWILLRGK